MVFPFPPQLHNSYDIFFLHLIHFKQTNFQTVTWIIHDCIIMEMISNFNFIHLRFNYTKPKGGSLFFGFRCIKYGNIKWSPLPRQRLPLCNKKKIGSSTVGTPIYNFFWGGGWCIVYCFYYTTNIKRLPLWIQQILFQLNSWCMFYKIFLYTH